MADVPSLPTGVPLGVNEPCGDRSPNIMYGILEYAFDCVYPIEGQFITFQRMALDGEIYWDVAEVEVYKPVVVKGES